MCCVLCCGVFMSPTDHLYIHLLQSYCYVHSVAVIVVVVVVSGAVLLFHVQHVWGVFCKIIITVAHHGHILISPA